MQVSKIIGLGLGVCVWLATNVGALTFEYADGTSITGDIIQGKPEFLQVRTADNKYEKVEWSKLSQATLTELQKDAKYAAFVQPYIEISQDEIIKKTEVVIKPVPRLERPAKGSLIGAMFKSSIGIMCLLLLYAANIYAGYEVAIIRAYPPAMVCGIAAVAPVIGPVVFLCLPTKLPASEEELVDENATPAPAPGAHSATYTAEPGDPGAAAPGQTNADGSAAAPGLPQTQVFKRGQFTFNRRFIETKFSAFFGAIRRGNDKDLVLIVKSVRGEHTATRISRIAANDMHLDVHKGGASHEVQVPFAEIQEIQIKHKDA